MMMVKTTTDRELCVRRSAERTRPIRFFQMLMNRPCFPDEESEAQDPEVTCLSSCSCKCLSLYLNSFNPLNPYSIFTWSFFKKTLVHRIPSGQSDFLWKVKVSGSSSCSSSPLSPWSPNVSRSLAPPWSRLHCAAWSQIRPVLFTPGGGSGGGERRGASCQPMGMRQPWMALCAHHLLLLRQSST